MLDASVASGRTKAEGSPPALDLENLIGRSPAMRELSRTLEVLSQSDTTVLIEGETGVGKNLVARILHTRSRRAAKPFVAFNSANLPKDLFESELFGHVKGAFSGAYQNHPGLARMADGGTLFIDEVGELSLASQAKLLCFLDRKEVRPVGGLRSTRVDLRVISATNRDLGSQVRAGAFRSDLYYRLRVLPLRVPSLRERQGDVPLLARHFLEKHCRRYGKSVAGISKEAMERLIARAWEGNVRELEHELERAVVLTPEGQEVRPEVLSTPLEDAAALEVEGPAVAPTTLAFSRAAAESELIQRSLQRHRWNVSAAARELGISRESLTRKLKRLGIHRPGTVAVAG